VLEELLVVDAAPAVRRRLVDDLGAELFPRLAPDQAAAMAFILATGAERNALRNALKTDIPEEVHKCSSVLVRGTKNEGRFAPVKPEEQLTPCRR
jgi:hypothetical protein